MEVIAQQSEKNRFYICKKLFNIAGIYLYKSKNLNAAFCMIIYILTFGLSAYLFVTVLVGSYDLLQTMYTAGFILAFLSGVSLIIKKNHLIKVFETLENGIFLPNIDRGGAEEKELMNDWITSLNKLCLLASPTMTMVVICTYIFWKFTKFQPLPFGLFVEIINVEITAFFQCAWFWILGSGYFFADMAFFMSLSHIRLHLKNLQISIKNLLDNSINDCLNDAHTNEQSKKHVVEWKYLQKRLKQVVSYHSAILDVSKLVDEAFHLCHLIKFIGLSCFLCLIIHGMSEVNITDGLFWILTSYSITVTVLMQVVNYYGNKIIIESQNIANCCYNIEFVGTNIKLQKSLLLMIQRSQRPITMTVGKFAPISVATSIAMMRATYSYFMVLQNQKIS